MCEKKMPKKGKITEKESLKERVQKRIRIVQDILDKNPRFAIGGSFALKVQGFALDREVKDLDFSVPENTQIWIPKEFTPKSFNDLDGYVDLMMRGEYLGVTINFVKRHTTDIIKKYPVKSMEFQPNVVSIESIMEAKERYVECPFTATGSIIKHLLDLNKYYKECNHCKKAEVPRALPEMKPLGFGAGYSTRVMAEAYEAGWHGAIKGAHTIDAAFSLWRENREKK